LHSIYSIDRIYCYNKEIDFNNPHDAISDLESLTIKVEEICPWANEFGVEGIGEGLVWTPINRDIALNTSLWFKTKGEEHSGKKNKIKIEIDPVVAENITKLVEKILPEWRLQQGISELKEQKFDIEIKNIGAYLKWIGQDIKKEEMDTVETNNFEWKDISKHANKKAKDYYFKMINQGLNND